MTYLSVLDLIPCLLLWTAICKYIVLVLCIFGAYQPFGVRIMADFLILGILFVYLGSQGLFCMIVMQDSLALVAYLAAFGYQVTVINNILSLS